MKDTDVKHSIAGFYFQLLIASYELVKIYPHKNAYVGVECDADIRVSYGNDNYIEAKFYNDKTFTRNHEAIRHTLYNFYNTYRTKNKDGNFIIKTNVPFTKSETFFFEEWNNKKFKIDQEYILYIKDCLVYEQFDKKKFKEVIDEFKENYRKKRPDLKNPQYKSALIEYLHENVSEYKKYIGEDLLISDDQILDFVKHVSFEIPDKKLDKYESILFLKEETEKNISLHFPSLSEEECANVRYLIMDYFLDGTVDKEKFKIKTKHLDELVLSHKEAINKLFENDLLANAISQIEKELIKYEQLLKRKIPEKAMSILEILDSCTEQWIKNMQNDGVKQTNRKYLMGEIESYHLNVLDLFKVMAEIHALSEQDLGKVFLSNTNGINNIIFEKFKSFSLRATPYSSEREDEYFLVAAFIQHTSMQAEMINAIGDETIIFEADCNICSYDKSNIDNIIIDISKPQGTILQQELYRSFNYKCTNCLKFKNKELECDFSKSFKEEIK